ncbi:MAG: uracil-DNA glycosylase [Cyanobacteriota bacterium]
MQLNRRCAACCACPLAESRSQVVVGRGNPEARLMVIGEGPGAEEDLRGLPFVGRSGQLLDRLLTEAGLDVSHDLYIANIVKCRPPENRRPTAREMAACRPWLDQQIALVDPSLIVLAGATALEGLLGIKSGISRLRGQWQRWGERQVLPVFHPAYLLRNPSRAPGSPIDLTLGDLTGVRRHLEQLRSAGQNG